MATLQETRTNSHGFPVIDCYRCKGSGTYSFNQVDGNKCYGCNGSGLAVRRGKAAKAWKEFLEAQPSKHITVQHMTPGDVIAWDKRWVTVVSVEQGNISGHSETSYRDRSTDQTITERTPHYNYRLILSDGTDRTLGEGSQYRRKITATMYPDPADYTAGL